jgi:hypothetical protein
MKFEKDKYYLLTLLDGTHHRVKFKGEDPANLLKFINKDGSPFTVPTGGFTDAKEIE